VSDTERVRGLLDGTVDPSDLEDDPELYSLAERIYGREALDEMGIAAPIVPTVSLDESDYSNGNNLEVELPEDLDEPEISTPKNKKKRPKLRLIAGFLGLIVIGFNVMIGIGAVIDLCENHPTDLPIEFNSVASMQNDSIHIRWTIANINPVNSYMVEWTISENGSESVVETDSFSWTSQNTYIHSENALIQQTPWCYISALFENGTQIATSNNCQGDIALQTMSQTESVSGECEDNPRLLWAELSEYESPESWTTSGSGGLIDGALLMLFGMMIISGLRRFSTS
tara:strand:+ start:3603 stop:4457 length:855 start_codon:yes stop_codon:yes gene_type:complete